MEDLTWAPAWKLREMIGAKAVSPVEVTQHFPHDGPADTELIAQGALDQAVAGTIEALRDCVAQFLQRQFAQRRCTSVDTHLIDHGFLSPV